MIDKYFSERNVKVVDLNLKNKKDALDYISNYISNQIDVEKDILHEGFMYREGQANTGVGEGIAIPHAVLDEVKRSSVYLFVIKNKVDWESFDNEKVDLIFTLVVPKNEHDNSHLKKIAKLSVKLIDKEFQDKLRSTLDTKELYKYVTEI